MGKRKSDEQCSLSYLRGRAVDEAWEKEVELVRQGKGTRNWTAEEQQELLETGRVEGYYGHHMLSVKTSPEHAGNKDNIQFLDYDEHIDGAHQSDTKNATNGYYDPETETMHEFQDGQVTAPPEREIENGFGSEEAREEAYKNGLVARNEAKADLAVIKYEEKMQEREDLSQDEKNMKLAQYADKKESEKEEFQDNVYGTEKTEETAEETEESEEMEFEDIEEAEFSEEAETSEDSETAESSYDYSASSSDYSEASSGYSEPSSDNSYSSFEGSSENDSGMDY